MKYVTRIAPSPTGFMHIGTARTALFNWLAARASGGKFILRIDDTDAERNKPEYEAVIHSSMSWLGLDYDQCFKQSEQGGRYAAQAKLLLEQGFAVELENGAIALKWCDFMPRHWQDEIAGEIAITDTNIEQIDRRLILVRGGDKLGQPTYQFCSVVDDWHWNINYIIRGVDHITNTAKQVAIWTALVQVHKDKHGACICHPSELPKFAHVGLIFKDKKKMSKRALGDVSNEDNPALIEYYQKRGYDPEAICNFLLRMGWGPSVDDKSNSIITRDRAIQLFLTGGNMRNSNAGFDEAKLNWYQKMYSKKAA